MEGKKRTALTVGAVILGVLVIGLLATNRPNTGDDSDLDVAAFYDGARIRWIIPYTPGGGYDEYARLIAPYLEKYTGARIEVSNLPGAGGMRAVNELYSAPRNGLTICMINGAALVMNQLAGLARYDIAELEFVGRIVADARVLVVSQRGNIKSFEDIMNSESRVTLGATGLGGSTYVDAMIIKDAFDLNINVVHGFDSSAVVGQAMLRGDVDGRWGSWGSAIDGVDSDLDLIVLQSGRERIADLPDVPTALEMADRTQNPEKTRTILNAWEALSAVGRPVAAPPGTPANKMEFLQEAFRQAMHDPELLQRLQRAGRPINYASGAELEEILATGTSLPPDIEELFVSVIRGGI